MFNIISNLTKTKYHSHMIYIYNLANFNIISSNKTDFRTYTIHFKDSYQLLLVSLSKLVKKFKVNT